METNTLPPEPNVNREPVQPALPADLRFSVQPYVPDGGFSIMGLMVVLLGLSLGGIALGVGTHYVSKWFYLILLFPMLIGIALGALGGGLVKWGKVRAPWLAGAAGLIAGILAMLTQHYLAYHDFINDPLLGPVRAEFRKNPKVVDFNLMLVPADQRQLLIRGLKVDSFLDFVDFQAHEGVSIKRAAAGNDKGLNLGYVGTYIYWAVETLIVAGIVFAMTRKPALEPFCSLSNEWKTVKCGDNFGVPLSLGVDQAAQLVKDGMLGQLAQAKAQAANNVEESVPVRLYVYASPQHVEQGQLDIKLCRFVAGKQGQVEEKEAAMVTYPADALPSLEKLCETA